VSVQETAFTYGITSFTVTTTNIAEGAKATVAWRGVEAPAGVTNNSADAVVSGNSLTLTTTTETPAGKYDFTVIIDGIVSGPAALRVAKADIAITFSIADDGFVGFPAETPVIYKDGGDGTDYKKTLTVTLEGEYTSHAWYVDGAAVHDANGASIALDAANYSARKHTLTVRVVKDGKPYSKEINFEVKNSAR
jgi:hypothetical protein